MDSWLEEISGLKSNCEKASKEKKNRRGALKDDIELVCFKRPSKKEDKDLKILCDRAKDLAKELGEKLYQDEKLEQWKKDIDSNHAKSVFLLAQINDIVFKERSGNAKTCAVCSMDNSNRMVEVKQTDSTELKAKAQRLPAIATRVIDGAVMKMARIVGGAIAKDKWEKIEKELKKGNKVRVPLVLEQNRFEFEPSREELVKNQRVVKKRKGKVLERKNADNSFKDKEQRIKDANKNKTCPYPRGASRIGDNGEIDHIIPRSSEYGTINDEANLIYASRYGKSTQKWKILIFKRFAK